MGLPLHLKETAEMLAFALALGNKLGQASTDGVIDFKDMALFLGPMLKLTEALNGADKIPGELRSMTSEDQALLEAYVIDNFDIPQDKIEERIEQGLAFGMAAFKYLKTWI